MEDVILQRNMLQPLQGAWHQAQTIAVKKFRCGHCDLAVASDRGLYFANQNYGNQYFVIHICPMCQRATYFEGDKQWPGLPFGNVVQHVPAEVEALFNEARSCAAYNAHTAAVLATRKLLMHIAVDVGAAPGQSFIQYVEYLANNGFVPPKGKAWVDHIRNKGNEANHEIVVMQAADAEDLITFAEMLLKFIYEFPKRVPSPPAAP